MENVYVILLNFKSWGETLECLESVFRNGYPTYRVVVCDNASNDGSLEHITAWAEGRLDVLVPEGHPLRSRTYPPVPKPIAYAVYDRPTAEGGAYSEDRDLPLIVIQTGANLGFAGGINVGLRYALAAGNFGYAWLLNNDTTIEPTALTALVTRMAGDAAAGLCGSTIMFYHQPSRVQCMAGGKFNSWICRTRILNRALSHDPEENRRLVERQLDFISGASMFVKKSFLDQVGLMSEDYFLFYEEIDWCQRAGDWFSLAYAPDSIVYHKHGASMERDIECDHISPQIDRLYLANRLKVARKFFPQAIPVVYATYLGAILNRLWRGQWNRIGMILDIMIKGR